MKNICFAYKMQMEAKFQLWCSFLEFVFDSRLGDFNTILIFSRLATCGKQMGNEYQFCINYEGLFPR